MTTLDEMKNPLQPQIPTPEESGDGLEIGPRRVSFFILVLKTFAGFGGGFAGTVVLLIIFLLSSSILGPLTGATVEGELAAGETSPLFLVVLMAMIFATSVVSSLFATLLLAYTERDRYNRLATTMGQVFLANIVIFLFVVPVYLMTSTARLELAAYAAGLQIIISTAASALILELLHDNRYPLLAVYNTLLAILVATALNLLLYSITGSATVLMFATLPVTWSFIGFTQAAFTMFYGWICQTWGVDYLANTASFGTDYGVPDQTEEEIAVAPDVEGTEFLRRE